LIIRIYIAKQVSIYFEQKSFSYEVKHCSSIYFIVKASLLRNRKPPIVHSNIRLLVLPITTQYVGTNSFNRYQKYDAINKD
jgi:hypothetical protein